MSKPELFRNYAADCLRSAQAVQGARDKALLFEMAAAWQRMADKHPDVTAGLAKIADKIPLVILSNAADSQIMSNVKLLGVPFHRVYTAEQAQAYKPRLRAFEYMLDQLRSGMEPAKVANLVHDAVVNQRFWVFTDMEMVKALEPRYQAILSAENPPAPAIGPG